MTRALNGWWSSVAMIALALMAAPCFVGIMLIPVGLGALMMSGLFVFLDEYRLVFMAAALLLLALTQWGLRYAREFRPTRLVWGITLVVLLLVVGELVVDPPWARHALVPM